ncbi:hypothetical protein SEUCBS139899_006959 [Sporothrix eucalyptigena]|uniref:Major facilitator superfamily (MFS) profile domain-containing protein n=1 Tax=Sporothrix eucalyptigena TaxID=1812306 RepID=A0ABP0C3R5_9PEZI
MSDIKETKVSATGNATDTDDNTLADIERPSPAAAIAEGDASGIRTKETDPEKNSISPAGSGDDDDNENDADVVEGIPPGGADLAQTNSFSFTDVPDGGFRAWLVVFGAWCTSFCSFGWINSVGIFQDYYQTGPLSSYSSSTISWIPSLQIFFIMAMGPIVGRLFDAYGPRHVILAGTLLNVFGLMMASISSQYYQFLLSQGVCSAIGVSAIFQPALSCIPGWFNKRRGIAYGIVSTGSSLGGVIFPIMVSRLIDSIGYGWAMRSCAFLILGLLIIANLTVHSRFHAHPNFKRGQGLTRQQMIAPFVEPGFALLLLGMFFLTFGIFVPITYIPVGALATGNVSASLANYLVSILNALSLFGRLLSGWASDRIGKYNAFVMSCYAAGIVVLALWIPGTSKSATIAFAALFGFFSGAYISLIASLVAQVSPHKEMGYRTGMVFLVASIPGLVTSPIAGAILANGDNWVGVKVFAGVLLLVGSTITLAARVKYAGFSPKTVF